jgi:hypothetical protein
MAAWLLSVFFALTANGALAAEPQTLTPVQVSALAEKIALRLDAHQADIALIARSGQPRENLPAGIRYTHTAFLLKTAQGWVTYNLLQDYEGADRSHLAIESLADFLKESYVTDVGLTLFKPEFAQKLEAFIQSPAYAQLHNPEYSLISNPFTPQFQNCTEFVLDVLYQTRFPELTLPQLKAKELAQFSPMKVQISWWEKYLAGLFREEVRIRDHSGDVYTTTYTSLAVDIEGRGLGHSLEVKL